MLRSAQKKAKMGWKGAGMKVKMAVALNADVKKMKVGTEKSFEEELRRREKVSERALVKTSILAMNQHPRNGLRQNGYTHHY